MYDPVKISDIHKIIEPEVSAILEPRGFQCVSELKWVCDCDQPIRKVFEFMQWKGGQFAPRWGVSLDFVPHISGSTVRWHRTNKSARSDLIIDSFDRSLDVPYRKGLNPIIEASKDVVPNAIEIASVFWEMTDSEEKLLDAFDWAKRYYDDKLPEGRSGFLRYVPHQLALSFVLARSGEIDNAKEEFSMFLNAKNLKQKIVGKLEVLFEASCSAQQ